MATWHQTQARKRKGFRLYHDTQWSAVTDPPNEGCSVHLFETRGEAIAWAQRQKHTYVLAPANSAAIGFVPLAEGNAPCP